MTDSKTVLEQWQAHHLAPLWLSPTAHRQPPPPRPAHLWRWAETRPLLDLALREATPAVVERRVLQYLTPDARTPEDEYTVGPLLCGVQGLLPGERARPHRHSMGALRLTLEGNGATTIVNGKPCPMEYGDLILTPAWCWHEHHHDGDAPVLWLDALDVPLHMWLGTAQFQLPPIDEMPVTWPDAAFATANFLPEDAADITRHSPVFRYPYAAAQAALAATPPSADGARRVRYVNPVTGGQAQALVDCALLALRRGQPTTPRRSNANHAYVVLKGHGKSRIGAREFTWAEKDFFIIPQGNFASHMATSDNAHLFVLSDSDVMRRLGVLHEDLDDAPQRKPVL